MAIAFNAAVPQGGGRTMYAGTYTHTLGAAEETFKLGSGRVAFVEVTSQDAGAKKELVAFTESISGATNTVTINAQNAVVAGRIVVSAFAGN